MSARPLGALAGSAQGWHYPAMSELPNLAERLPTGPIDRDGILEIFVDKAPRIEENAWPYSGFRVGVTSSVGEDTIILPPINMDHCFMVHIPVGADEITEEMVVKIHNIINLEKPAHTTYFLQFQTEEERAAPQVFMQVGVSHLGVPDLRYDEVDDTSEDT